MTYDMKCNDSLIFETENFYESWMSLGPGPAGFKIEKMRRKKIKRDKEKISTVGSGERIIASSTNQDARLEVRYF